MKVPLLDLKAQLHPLRSEIHKAVIDVIDSTSYIMGPKVDELEASIAKYCDVKHAIGVTSGTDALLVALMALDVGPGDIVITTPYSFFASIGVVARLNATPVLVEIDERSFNMDPNALEKWFSSNPDKAKKVKAIIPIHLFGQCADMDPLIAIGEKYGVPLIEDAAQAIGATYPSKSGTRKAGSMTLMGCYSFFPSKNLGGVGDGGMVVTSDDKVGEKLRKLRVHGSKPKYYHSLIGGNFRLDPIQAAVLSVKLPHLEAWHAARRDNAHFYDETLDIPEVSKPFVQWGRNHHIYNQYVVTVNGKRDELRTFLGEQGIGTEVYYPVPFHLQECFKYLGHKKGDFPKSERGAENSLAIPIYPELSKDQKEYVVSKIGAFYGH